VRVQSKQAEPKKAPSERARSGDVFHEIRSFEFVSVFYTDNTPLEPEIPQRKSLGELSLPVAPACTCECERKEWVDRQWSVGPVGGRQSGGTLFAFDSVENDECDTDYCPLTTDL